MMTSSKNIASSFAVCLALSLILACNFQLGDNSQNQSVPSNASPSPTKGSSNSTAANQIKKAYKISGMLDEAKQEGNVCDTSVKFNVPGTLEFEFTPSSSTEGTYKYTGPFNAKGEGPYKINDDGTMMIDGTGCIMGKCATYSHEWKAEPIDPATCK